jgi:uridylate kinase
MSVAFIKVSGEALNEGATAGEKWTDLGRQRTVATMGAVATYMRNVELQPQRYQGEGRVHGAVFVFGAGNLAMRGEMLQKAGIDSTLADQMGMVGTLWNAQVVAGDLRDRRIPARLLKAPSVGYEMPGMSQIDDFSPEQVCDSIVCRELVVIGGGSGKTGQTTDAAVLDLAVEYRDALKLDTLTFKSTKYDGVFDADPALSDDARQLRRVSAARMRDEGWSAVDPQCLDLIEEHGISMRVYASQAPLEAAVAGEVGTLIVPQRGILEFAR